MGTLTDSFIDSIKPIEDNTGAFKEGLKALITKNKGIRRLGY